MTPSRIHRPHYIYGSVARIANFEHEAWKPAKLERDAWNTGDYVLGEVVGAPSTSARLELVGGRRIEPMAGDLIVGSLGVRCATLEVVGDWRNVNDDGVMQVIGGGGVIGKATSISPFLPRLTRLRYVGHVTRAGQKQTMRQFAPTSAPHLLKAPVVLLIGTSMSAGKTTAAKAITRILSRRGLRVVGAKLTGAGRQRDILGMGDAGACAIYDFVDGGLPTTACPPEEFETAIRPVLSMIASQDPDVVVVEAGASPLEPYNGARLVEMLRASIRSTVLCASDPYAVVGILGAFNTTPTVVCGIATNTSAGRNLIEELSGVPAINVRDSNEWAKLDELLNQRLEHSER